MFIFFIIMSVSLGPGQMWGGAFPGPGADVAWLGPVPGQTWQE